MENLSFVIRRSVGKDCVKFSYSSVFNIFLKLSELLDFPISLITQHSSFLLLYVISCSKQIGDQRVPMKHGRDTDMSTPVII
jgi:hypothetical protein